MFLTGLRTFFRKTHPRHRSSGGSAARRSLTRRPELEVLEDRLTPSNYTNLAVAGAVVVTSTPASPIQDVTIRFSAVPGSSFTLDGNAHNVKVIGGIPAGDSVTLNGNVSDATIQGAVAGTFLLNGNAHDVTIQGPVAGTFLLNGSGNDVRMGDVSGSVQLGSSTTPGSIHDFTAGEIETNASFHVFDAFHDGTVGPLDAGSDVFFNPDHHRLTIRMA
jgi:hypothetical protein